jgi:hypothetical protein
MDSKSFLELSYYSPLRQSVREKIASAYNKGDKKAKYLDLNDEEISTLKQWGYKVIKNNNNTHEVEV